MYPFSGMHYADLPFHHVTSVPSTPQNAAPFKTGSQKPKKSVSNVNVKPVALPASDTVSFIVE
jgi:hypothetical protein